MRDMDKENNKTKGGKELVTWREMRVSKSEMSDHDAHTRQVHTHE